MTGPTPSPEGLAIFFLLLFEYLLSILPLSLSWTILVVYTLFFRDRNWKKIIPISVVFLLTVLLMPFLVNHFVYSYLTRPFPEYIAHLVFLIPLGLNFLYLISMAYYLLKKRSTLAEIKPTIGIKILGVYFILVGIVSLIMIPIIFLLKGAITKAIAELVIGPLLFVIIIFFLSSLLFVFPAVSIIAGVLLLRSKKAGFMGGMFISSISTALMIFFIIYFFNIITLFTGLISITINMAIFVYFFRNYRTMETF